MAAAAIHMLTTGVAHPVMGQEVSYTWRTQAVHMQAASTPTEWLRLAVHQHHGGRMCHGTQLFCPCALAVRMPEPHGLPAVVSELPGEHR